MLSTLVSRARARRLAARPASSCRFELPQAVPRAAPSRSRNPSRARPAPEPECPTRRLRPDAVSTNWYERTTRLLARKFLVKSVSTSSRVQPSAARSGQQRRGRPQHARAQLDPAAQPVQSQVQAVLSPGAARIGVEPAGQRQARAPRQSAPAAPPASRSSIIQPKSCTGSTSAAISEPKPAASVAQAQKIGAASSVPVRAERIARRGPAPAARGSERSDESPSRWR